MKKYSDPTFEVVRFDVMDRTNANDYNQEGTNGVDYPIGGGNSSPFTNNIWQEIHW